MSAPGANAIPVQPIVERDHEGTPLPGAGERTHSEVPALFLEQDRKTIGSPSVVRRAHPLIPDGITSTAADLLLVPHGPFKGLMLGQKRCNMHPRSLSDWRVAWKSEIGDTH